MTSLGPNKAMHSEEGKTVVFCSGCRVGFTGSMMLSTMSMMKSSSSGADAVAPRKGLASLAVPSGAFETLAPAGIDADVACRY